jgi:YfiH family protein
LLPSAARAVLQAAEVDGIPMLLARLPGPFRVAFTTRHGGASSGSYGSLNLGVHTTDSEDAVAWNRLALGAALGRLVGAEAPELVSPRQVHGTRVTGTAEYRAEVGGEDPFGERSGCDGLTLRPLLDDGLASLLLFADCVPVVLASEVDVAVAHGGWRGLLGGVVQQAARAMTAPPGLAVIGPSIGPCCYRVAPDLAADFERRYGPGVTRDGDRLDLWEVAARALEEVEVPRSRVTNPRLCTACHPELFFSHRREGPDTGRHGAVAWLAPGEET